MVLYLGGYSTDCKKVPTFKKKIIRFDGRCKEKRYLEII